LDQAAGERRGDSQPPRCEFAIVQEQPYLPAQLGKSRSFTDVAKSAATPGHSPPSGSSSSSHRRKQVCFRTPPTMATFRRWDPPTVILGRPAFSRQLEPRKRLQPILKKDFGGPLGAKIFINSSCESEQGCCASDRPYRAEQEHGAQEADTAQPWQTVRKRYWWRKRGQPSSHVSYTRPRLSLKTPHEKFKGRCFHWLARDHLKISCRDPPKCWRCWRSGHISPHCPGTRHLKVKPKVARLSTLNRSPSISLPIHSSSSSHTPPPSATPSTHQPHAHRDTMAHRLSLGSSSVGSRRWYPGIAQDRGRAALDQVRPRAADFPGIPRRRPRVVEKLAWASDEIQQRREMLTHHALLVTEEGSLGVASREEVDEIIGHQFDLLRYEFHVFRNTPEPFIVLFSDRAAIDVVFTRGKVSDGRVELRFHAWDVDRVAERCVLPFHVKLSIEGLPQHAWVQDIADKVLCDEASIHHVDQATRRRIDHRFYVCWAFCQNPSRIPQLVYLTLIDRHHELRLDAQLHFSRPRNIKLGLTFKVLIHIDSVEDLMFYHHPPEQLLAEGKTQFCEFFWRPGQPDGDLGEEDIRPTERFYRPGTDYRRRPREDDGEDRNGRCPRGREILRGVSHWFDNRGKGRANYFEQGNRRGWFRGESSGQRRQHLKSLSPPPCRDGFTSEEKRALRGLGADVGINRRLLLGSTVGFCWDRPQAAR
jgi:hypothetical protein